MPVKWRAFFAFIYKMIFSWMSASRLTDWWWGDRDPDSSASAAFCGFSVSHAEPGAVGRWREWLHRDGPAPESCQCTFHDSMNSDVKDQAEVTLLHIISGSHPNGVPPGWRSSRCCLKSPPTAKKSWTARLPFATWASGVHHSFLQRKMKWIYLCFSVFSLWNLLMSDPTSTQLRCWVLWLIIPGLIETKTPRLMNEMYVSAVWMPLGAASGCPLLLQSLWTVSVSLNKKLSLCRVKSHFISLVKAQSCHYKRGTKLHRIPSAHWIPEAALIAISRTWTLQERNMEMEMVPCARLTTLVLWFCWCGFRGQTRAAAVWFGIIFPSGADRMSLMNHSVFQLSHLNSPHHYCVQQGKEHAVEQERILWRIHQIQEMVSQKPQKSNSGYDLWNHLWLTHNDFKGSSQEIFVLCLNTSSDLFSWRVPLFHPERCLQSDLTRYAHTMALLPCPNVRPVYVAATERKQASVIITVTVQ